MSTYDVKSRQHRLGTRLMKPQTISWRTEKMAHGKERNRWSTIHWSIRPQGEQKETIKCCNGEEYQQKTLLYVPEKNYIIDYFKAYKVTKFITEILKKGKVKLRPGGTALAVIIIQKVILQEDALLPLLFVITMMLHNHVLKICTAGCRFTKLQE